MSQVRLPWNASSTASPPRLARDLRPFHECLRLRPRDLRMRAAAEAAVGARDHVLAPYSLRAPPGALRDELEVLDDVGRVRDAAGSGLGSFRSSQTAYSCSWQTFAASTD